MKYGYTNILPRVYIRAYLHAYSVIHTVFICTQTIPNILLLFPFRYSIYKISDKQLIINNYFKSKSKGKIVFT